MHSAFMATQHAIHTRPFHFCCHPPSTKCQRVNSHPEENAESKGDEALQEELVRQIQKSMGKQRLIEAAKRSMEQAEKERLKSRVQREKERIEKRQKLELDRSRLEFDSRQADVNKAADDFDEILRRDRAGMERSKAEFEEFERALERERNQHLFFKGLYTTRDEARKTAKKSKKSGPMKNRDISRSDQISTAAGQEQSSKSRASVERALRLLVYALTAFNISALAYTGVDSLQDSRRPLLSLLLATSSLLLMRYIWWAKRKMISDSGMQ